MINRFNLIENIITIFKIRCQSLRKFKVKKRIVSKSVYNTLYCFIVASLLQEIDEFDGQGEIRQ